MSSSYRHPFMPYSFTPNNLGNGCNVPTFHFPHFLSQPPDMLGWHRQNLLYPTICLKISRHLPTVSLYFLFFYHFFLYLCDLREASCSGLIHVATV
jgi:hypothetical protein